MSEKTMDAACRDAVKEYLQQFHMARERKRILERRHDNLVRELKAPALGSAYRTMPTKRTQANSDGAVSVVFRIAEVEDRIEKQRGEMTNAVLHVMDLIDLLPQDSTERTVVELRHIDCMGWDKIAEKTYMSRSNVFNYYNAALDALLSYKRTEKLVREYIAKHQGRGKKAAK